MDDNLITGKIIELSINIHREVGPGLLEKVYEAILEHELQAAGLPVARQVKIPIRYKTLLLEEAYYADLIVCDRIIIELKSIEKVHPVHKKQLLTHLKLADKPIGLLINFGEELLKNGITRIKNGY